MIVIEWESKNGKMRRICIGSGKACGSLPPIGQSNEENNGNTTISIEGKHFSNNAAILVDRNFQYGLVSEQPSELAFKNLKVKNNLIKLNEIVVEFKDTRERLSVMSLISIIENNQEGNKEITCNCID